MQVKERENNIDFKKIEFVIVLALIIFFESFYDVDDLSINEIMKQIFGGVIFLNHNYFLVTVIRFLLPQFGIILLWGNYFYSNIVTNYELIFTRTRKSYIVLSKYAVKLFIYVFTTTIFLEIVLIFVYLYKGGRIHSFSDICIDLILYCFYIVCITLIVNIISLAIKGVYSVSIVFAILLFLLECTFRLVGEEGVNKVYYLLPTSPALLMQNAEIKNEIKIILGIYLIGIMVISFFLGCIYTHHKEYY